MDPTDSSPKYHVILIGINAYEEKPLSGCVRDVNDIRKFLCDNVKVFDSLEILTASDKADSNSANSLERPSRKPTYANVVSALEQVTSKASQGDFLYIHYSGHGTRAKPESEFSNSSTGDLALVLLDSEDQRRTRYLWGHRLALSLRSMVVKGLTVTLVLDCCFSASVYRRPGSNSRFLPHSPLVDSAYLSDAKRNYVADPKQSKNRDASMMPNWLINPDGYTILAACGPDEEASEPSFNGQKHGALSYCLLRCLEDCNGLTENIHNVFDYVRSAFRRFKIDSQSPVLYGNPDLGFFGRARTISSLASAPIVANEVSAIEIQAGQAHGISDGDQFHMHSFNFPGNYTMEQKSAGLLEVANSGAFTSTANLMNAASVRPQTGWSAVLFKSCMLRRFHVSVSKDVPHYNKWLEVFENALLDPVLDAELGFCTFHITFDKGHYEILDDSKNVFSNLPLLPLNGTDLAQARNMLEHLAKYKLVCELTNHTSKQEFLDSFSILVTNQSGNKLEADSWFEEPRDEISKITLKFVNKGSQKLYVHIYNLGPRWEISNIYRATYQVVPPRKIEDGFAGETQKTVKLIVPSELRELGQQYCNDIVKIFVTSEPTSFRLLELPKIGEKAFTRHTEVGLGREGELPSEDWAAFNFKIRKSLR